MIMLDSVAYGCMQVAYTPQPQKFQSVERGLTGKLLVSQLGVEMPDHYKMTLRCTPAQLVTLKASFVKDGFLDFTDELGTEYLVADSSGVLFVSMGEERPLLSSGYVDGNLFLVDIDLEPNSP